MDTLAQKAYGVSGLFLIVLSILNTYFQVGYLRHNYVFMCVGLFLFFDSLNFFLSDQDSLLQHPASIHGLVLFAVFFGAVIGFFMEFYAGYLIGAWEGLFEWDMSETAILVMVNQAIDLTFVYGVLALPAYSIFRILDKVFKAEVMLCNEFDGSDYYRYFVHTGLLLLAAPFTLLFLDLGANLRFLMLTIALLGLLFVIEYFEFRKKGEGIIINLFNGQLERVSAIITTSMIVGVVVAIITSYFDMWSGDTVPFNEFSLFGMPAALFIIWALIVAVIISGINLITDKGISNLD